MDILNAASAEMYTILVLIVNFQYNQRKKWTSSLKLAVILSACSVVTLKLRKQYLNTVIYNTSVLLWIKSQQFDI